MTAGRKRGLIPDTVSLLLFHEVVQRLANRHFFTVVYLYIIGSFVWWWWLLQSNNKENYETLIQRERITYMSYSRSEGVL